MWWKYLILSILDLRFDDLILIKYQLYEFFLSKYVLRAIRQILEYLYQECDQISFDKLCQVHKLGPSLRMTHVFNYITQEE